MNETAVKWLFQQLWEAPKDKFTWHSILEEAKQMEKEQMIEFAEYVASYPDKNRNHNGEMLHAKSKYDGAERTIDLLEIWLKEYKTK